jgi:pheromone shutdown protein TraB
MITLIGVGHVFAISDNVKEVIRLKRPELVCLELDPARYHSLMQRERSGSIPIQYRLLSYFQKRMAGKFGTEVGDEMMAAVAAAGEVGAKIALIDMDAARVFAKLWSKMSFREKLNLIGGALVGLVLSKETVEKEMDKYETNEAQYLESMGKELPSVKEVLIDDRNKHMADKLGSLAAQHKNIVAVVGDGHIPGLLQSLGAVEVETIRLRDLRSGPIEARQNAAEYNVSFWYHNE